MRCCAVLETGWVLGDIGNSVWALLLVLFPHLVHVRVIRDLIISTSLSRDICFWSLVLVARLSRLCYVSMWGSLGPCFPDSVADFS